MKLLKKIFYLFTPLALGTIVGFIMKGYNNFEILNKPKFSPPGILFPIVWSILYLLMGYSFFKYKNEHETDIKIDIIYYVQLFFNLMWSIIFFNLNMRLFAFIWLIILDILVIIWLFMYSRLNKNLALINIPYLIWILFASYLNLSVYLLNM